ncbi:MAG: hypothetical protein VW948_02040, partial [Burkholderiaceae bacterium]
ASVLYGHFCIEHVKGHHVRVATPNDPATAKRGQSLYGFFLQSISGTLLHSFSLQKLYLEEHNITTVFDMGDTFDNRRSIDLWSLEWAKENYYDRLEKLGITVHTIVGNHTAYYKDTNSINSVDLLLKQYKNVKIYAE